MRNLWRIKQRERTKPDLVTDCEGLVLVMPNGEEARLHIGNNGWVYVNGIPVGMLGMPPSPHAETHFLEGADALAPQDIGAASLEQLGDLAQALADMNSLLPGLVAQVVEGALAGLAARVEELEARCVLSEGIASIEGQEICAGVGAIHYTPREEQGGNDESGD